MTDPFAAALDALFNAPGSLAATYTPEETGEPAEIRVIRDQASKTANFGGDDLIVDTNDVQIRKSEVAMPKAGDRLAIGDDEFAIQGGPMLDVEGLTWRCYLEPAE